MSYSIAYRGYMIRGYSDAAGGGYWVEKDGHTVLRYAGTVDAAKKIIDELLP